MIQTDLLFVRAITSFPTMRLRDTRSSRRSPQSFHAHTIGVNLLALLPSPDDDRHAVKETLVSKLRVNAFTVSADGFGAGPDQGRDQPLGRGGEELHQWFLPTRTFQRNVLRRDGGTTGIDNDFAARSFENLGAWIMGRNMFGPVRGPWPDHEWKGWWGANPPYHVPVFVLTHHPRPPLEMEGGTVFHFVTAGIEAALDQARAAARG